MDFDAFLEDVKKKVKVKKTVKKSRGNLKDRTESVIFDDKCSAVPQTDSGIKVYK